ncbi:MAG: tRNA dihydrouridine synthase DusB [Thermodesulfobacteriota bacterium]|nr:tRNA dihydrouridine synthase DusB [Thermodesulfobacteriota bacterium]
MRAYNNEFRYGLFLAPMSGITDSPMRILCREYGAELAFTEMISATGIVRSTKNTMKLLNGPEGDKPLIAQIFTSEPQDAALSAKILQEEGFDGIDINMGCPVKKVVSKGAGAALMRDQERAMEIVEAVLSLVTVPVSVKLRAGWDRSSITAVSLAKRCAHAGVNAIIIHPRTRSEMFGSPPRWELISSIKHEVDIPVIASGNIGSVKEVEHVKSLGADAYMIGRASVGRPWIFRELRGGPAAGPIERKELLLRHLDMLCSYYGRQRGILRMRKFLSAYVKGLSKASAFRQDANHINEPGQLESLIERFDWSDGEV